jgi:hypothetical protein
MKLPLITASIMALFLGACTTSPPIMMDMPVEDATAIEDPALVRWMEASAAIGDMTNEEVRTALVAELSDRTSIVRQEGHGIYVEYTAPDGRFFSWYPGNTSVEKGLWSISGDASPPEACFKYKDSFHPLTGEFEPEECVPAVQIIGRVYVVDSRQGDVFELGTKGIPYAKTAEDLPAWPADR